ncbi:MAG: Flagellar hook-associated protein FlgL [Anaerolineae bacterium]|jgi:flagellar hook-associated protein 3 FlgL|nr:MAG: Flagellar hook-associated protein FlgL [Anaerolineae bacterium]
MRITQRMMTERAIEYMDENLKRLYQLQEKVSSGKEFLRPSDNPSGVNSALNLRSVLKMNNAYLDSAATTESWMSATDYALIQTTQLATRAMNLTRQGMSDTLGAEQRNTLAAELDMVLQQVLSVANTSHQGNYIFGGFQTLNPPFALTDSNSDGTLDTVVRSGDSGTINRLISPNLTVVQNVNGYDLFNDLMVAIMNARDALRNNGDPNQMNDLQSAIAALETQINNANEALTTNGARQREVRLIKDRLEKSQIELKSLLSQKEDVNMTEAISYLQHQQTVYQTVLEVGKRAISALSLFDLLG